MTHHRYISIIGITGLISLLAWVVVVYKLNPYESMALALAFFYTTLFISLSSFFTVFGFYLRVWIFKNEIFYKHINISLRQGVFLSLIAVVALVFQMMKVLSWWSGLLLVLVFVLLEMYFSSRDSQFL